jgi:hypothetical protein
MFQNFAHAEVIERGHKIHGMGSVFARLKIWDK